MTINANSAALDAESTAFSTTEQGVAYDAGLIGKLIDDHANLTAILTRLGAVTNEGLGSVAFDLNLLRESFQSHILTEKVNFYAYLDRLLVDHPAVREEAHAVWIDMNEIATSIAYFIHDWTALLPTEETLPKFLEQLQRTRQVLVGRIELEERTLYTLYTETL